MTISFRRVLPVVFTLVCLATTASAQPAPGRLLEHAVGQPAQSRGAGVATMRRSLARVDGQALARERIELTLFDAVRVTARRTSRSHPRQGSMLWQGQLEAPDEGEVTLAMVEGVIAGTIAMGGRTFEIGFAGAGLHELREVNPALFPTEDFPADVISSSGTGTSSSPATAGDAAGQIDVMVVWTPAARAAAGGSAAAIQSVVDLAVANANAAYTRSGVSTGLRLAYSGEVNFTETPSAITSDLSLLTGSGDGQLDNVHTLRSQYGADIVTLFGSGYAGAGYCGVGYLMSSVSTSFASYAFNVVDQSCAAGNLSYAHEVGHNQGLQHDPPNAASTPSHPFAYGFQDPNGAFRTVMSYGGAPRVQNLSNPNVQYNGWPTGTASQNNAEALNRNAATVANFRAASTSTPCDYSVTPTSMDFDALGGIAIVNVTTSAGCAWTVSSGAGWITLGTGGSGSGSVVVTVAPNLGGLRTATAMVAGVTVNITEAGVTPTCTFAVSPTSLGFEEAGGTATVSVTTQAGCSWTTGTDASWLSVANGTTGSGTVAITAAANTGGARNATVTVAGQAVTVSQTESTQVTPPATCTFSLSATSLTMPSTGGTLEVVVTTQDECGWSARSQTGWMKVTGGGTGSGSATLQVNSGSGGTRVATAIIAGQFVTVTQQGAPKGK